MGFWGYPRYVSVEEKRAKAEKKLKQLMKKNPAMRPVMIQGTAIANTWWGKSWNKNLERYADYSNRIGRGRSYVRHRAVLDLQIEPGRVDALVQGSASRPYAVTIGIEPISPATWKAILQACDGKMASLQALLAGKFPKDLEEVFMAKGKGLFPSPDEISLSCSCPDWAVMCKHVAAVLYGIGARLDEDPNLFFKLRKADVGELVSKAVTDQTHTLLEKAKKKSSRVMAEADLSEVFGIDLSGENDDDAVKPKAPVRKKTPGRQTAAAPKTPAGPRTRKAKTAEKDRKKPAGLKASAEKPPKTSPAKPRKKAPPKKPSARTVEPAAAPSTHESAVARVEALIRKSRKGIGIPELMEKTGFDRKKINNIVFRLKMKQKIRSVSRGIFIGNP